MVTFTDLGIEKAGSGYTLSATSPNLSGDTSAPFNITSAAAAQLAFGVSPGGAVAGTSFTTQPQILIQDAYGNTVASSSAAVTLSITPGTGGSGATLSGSTTVNAANGIANFSGLSIDLIGSGYTLAASSPGLVGAQCLLFSVTVATPIPSATVWALIALAMGFSALIIGPLRRRLGQS